MPKNKKNVLILLGALMALSPFSIDMYLSSFPAIAASLKTDVAHVGYSLTSYFIGVCVGQLLYGILIDRYGRKKPVVIGMIIYLFGCLGCALAPALDALILFRIVMALGGCVGMVASRAIVRDLFPSDEIAKVLSQLVLVMAVAPIIAPAIGSFVNNWLGWRWVFGVMALIALATLAAVLAALPETKTPDRSVSLKIQSIWSEYAEVLNNRLFIQYAVAGGIAYAGMFAYIAGSPFVFMEKFHLSTTQYTWAFALNVFWLTTGSQLNRIVLKKFEVETVSTLSVIGLFVCGLIFLTATLMGVASLTFTLCFTCLFLFFLGSFNPTTQALALRPFNNAAGRCSAVLGSLQMTAAAIASWLVSFLHNGSLIVMPFVMLVCALVAFVIILTTIPSAQRYAER